MYAESECAVVDSTVLSDWFSIRSIFHFTIVKESLPPKCLSEMVQRCQAGLSLDKTQNIHGSLTTCTTLFQTHTRTTPPHPTPPHHTITTPHHTTHHTITTPHHITPHHTTSHHTITTHHHTTPHHTTHTTSHHTTLCFAPGTDFNALLRHQGGEKDMKDARNLSYVYSK